MFVIIRHGNTFENGTTPRRIGARTDLPLTAEGVEQSRTLAAHFTERGLAFDRVLVSPLTRTRQTAEIVLAAQRNPPDPQPAEFLREIDYGPDENRPENEVRARLGEEALAAWESRAEVPDGWIVDAKERLSAWKTLLDDAIARHQVTLLVTSNGAARFALMADPDLLREAARLPSYKLPTGGLGVLVPAPQGGWRVDRWGERP